MTLTFSRNAAGQPGAILSGTMVVSASESVSQSDPDTTLHSILSFSANGPYPADEDGVCLARVLSPNKLII
jgi:hypothetical protein